MRIAFSAPGCPPNSDIDFPTRGEGRWSLNWMHVLREAGQDVFQVFDYEQTGFQSDLYMNAGWWGTTVCSNPNFSFQKHGHLYFGVVNGHSFFDQAEASNPQATCIREGRCNVHFGYPRNFHQSLEVWKQNSTRNYGIGCMPIPFSESMLPERPSFNFNRTAISWMSKEVFHPRQVELNTILYRTGLVYLEALARFSRKANFTLFFLQDYPPTPAAEVFLNQMHVQRFQMLSFTDVLRMMSMVKVNAAVAGTASSTLDAVFRRAVPLAKGGSFLNYTLTRERPEAVMPIDRAPSVDEVYNLLDRMWFDYPFYRYMDEAHQLEMMDHRKEQALIHFDRFLETMV